MICPPRRPSGGPEARSRRGPPRRGGGPARSLPWTRRTYFPARCISVACARTHQPEERHQIDLSESPDLYWNSLESGELWYKSRDPKRRFSPTLRAGGKAVSAAWRHGAVRRAGKSEVKQALFGRGSAVSHGTLRWSRAGGKHACCSTRLPGDGKSNTHGTRPARSIISEIRRIWARRLSIKKSLSL